MKKIFLISLLLLVVFSCKDDEKDIVSPDREYSPRVIQETYGNAKLVGFVNDKNGNPLSDVTVFFGEEKTTTGSDGSYQLNTLSAGANKRIWFEKEGYASTQKLADISEELPNRIDASLFPIGKTMKMTSDGGKIETENFSVEIEPGGFVYSDGTPVEEDVIVEATAFLAMDDELLNAFPGEFRGKRTDGTTTAIESFGFIDVELKVESGEPVQLAEGVNATIKIKATENAPQTIPMWHYDEGKAKWIEEGVGKLNEGFYSANVTHFTKWNWDRPYDETSKLVGRVIDSDGNPIEGARVVQKGITYRFQNSTKTDENGEFELLTPEFNDSEIEALFDIYGSTVVNYTTSPTKGHKNDIGDIIIEVSIDNVVPPYIIVDVLYVTSGRTMLIRGKYFGEEKRQGYKLLLNGNEIGTSNWSNELIEFELPSDIPEYGTIQINRDGVYSKVVKYEEGIWTCEIGGKVFNNNNLPTTIKGKYHINADRKGLFEIPDCLINLQNLMSLDIHHNQLTYLPESFGNLQNLEFLDLSLNRLESLPESFGNFKNLEILDLMANQITTLPDSFTKLGKLKEFSFGSNQISTLPEKIHNLSELEELYLGDNMIESLPESIGDLNNLEILDLTKNQLSSLPFSLGNLNNLRVLSLRSNKLTILPESIGNLKNLRTIILDNNDLVFLPNSVGDLVNLDALSISENDLEFLPESIGNLKNLESLSFNNNNIKTLPESIGNLQKIRTLSLNTNNLIEFPESFGELQNLERLFARFNSLKSLPESIGNLKSLTYLSLENNQISSLPESIKNLRLTLKSLELDGNNFSEEEKAKIEGWLPNTNIDW